MSDSSFTAQMKCFVGCASQSNCPGGSCYQINSSGPVSPYVLVTPGNSRFTGGAQFNMSPNQSITMSGYPSWVHPISTSQTAFDYSVFIPTDIDQGISAPKDAGATGVPYAVQFTFDDNPGASRVGTVTFTSPTVVITDSFGNTETWIFMPCTATFVQPANAKGAPFVNMVPSLNYETSVNPATIILTYDLPPVGTIAKSAVLILGVCIDGPMASTVAYTVAGVTQNLGEVVLNPSALPGNEFPCNTAQLAALNAAIAANAGTITVSFNYSTPTPVTGNGTTNPAQWITLNLVEFLPTYGPPPSDQLIQYQPWNLSEEFGPYNRIFCHGTGVTGTILFNNRSDTAVPAIWRYQDHFTGWFPVANPRIIRDHKQRLHILYAPIPDTTPLVEIVSDDDGLTWGLYDPYSVRLLDALGVFTLDDGMSPLSDTFSLPYVYVYAAVFSFSGYTLTAIAATTTKITVTIGAHTLSTNYLPPLAANAFFGGIETPIDIVADSTFLADIATAILGGIPLTVQLNITTSGHDYSLEVTNFTLTLECSQFFYTYGIPVPFDAFSPMSDQPSNFKIPFLTNITEGVFVIEGVCSNTIAETGNHFTIRYSSDTLDFTDLPIAAAFTPFKCTCVADATFLTAINATSVLHAFINVVQGPDTALQAVVTRVTLRLGADKGLTGGGPPDIAVNSQGTLLRLTGEGGEGVNGTIQHLGDVVPTPQFVLTDGNLPILSNDSFHCISLPENPNRWFLIVAYGSGYIVTWTSADDGLTLTIIWDFLVVSSPNTYNAHHMMMPVTLTFAIPMGVVATAALFVWDGSPNFAVSAADIQLTLTSGADTINSDVIPISNVGDPFEVGAFADATFLTAITAAAGGNLTITGNITSTDATADINVANLQLYIAHGITGGGKPTICASDNGTILRAALGMPPAWDSTVTYSEGDAVTYSGQLYVSQQNTNKNHQPDTSPSWWTVYLEARIIQGSIQHGGDPHASSTFIFQGYDPSASFVGPAPIIVFYDSFNIVQGREGPNRLVLVCTVFSYTGNIQSQNAPFDATHGMSASTQLFAIPTGLVATAATLFWDGILINSLTAPDTYLTETTYSMTSGVLPIGGPNTPFDVFATGPMSLITAINAAAGGNLALTCSITTPETGAKMIVTALTLQITTSNILFTIPSEWASADEGMTYQRVIES